MKIRDDGERYILIQPENDICFWFSVTIACVYVGLVTFFALFSMFELAVYLFK